MSSYYITTTPDICIQEINQFIIKPNPELFIKYSVMGESYPDDPEHEAQLKIRYVNDYKIISDLLDKQRIDVIINEHVFFDDSTKAAMFMTALSNKNNSSLSSFEDFKEALIKSLKYPTHLKLIEDLPTKLEDVYLCAKESIYINCMSYLVTNLVSFNEIVKFELAQFGLPEEWNYDFPTNKQSVLERAFMLGIKEDVSELNDDLINKYSKIYETDFATMKVICERNYGYLGMFQSIRDQFTPELMELLNSKFGGLNENK